MPLDQSFIGREYPPTPTYEVGREKIREFAEAIKDRSPLHRDPEAAKAAGYPDVIAPPTFAVLLSMKAHDAIVEDPQLGLDYSRVVHGQQEFTHHRPIQAGDRLRTVVHVDDIKARTGNDFLTVRAEITTVEGEPVCTAKSTLVARGTAEDPEGEDA
ncbi:MaoC family dehydratase N-terminal domain-containing protein [Saccharopolyspora erythraea]|uniref:MaoC family dehydratase N-terminal domain-containing protein n=1 Tax=Saccharopolyspora erythraea TaxID=1836 RepID=UPI001BAAA8D3|nr:MaoC family dehydratase N-terminal domain-containing protein [Saccharopolyspora erythraea]QUH05231.1 MaoC family dehydratase N-terminal domain-containing protein [Saccharopolyspora erythraea]